MNESFLEVGSTLGTLNVGIILEVVIIGGVTIIAKGQNLIAFRPVIKRKSTYKRMIRSYFSLYSEGTVRDIIDYFKSERIRYGSSPSNIRRGLLIPSRCQLSSILRGMGAKKVGVIGRSVIWSLKV